MTLLLSKHRVEASSDGRFAIVICAGALAASAYRPELAAVGLAGAALTHALITNLRARFS